MKKWLPDSPQFPVFIEQFGEGLPDDKAAILRAGIIAYADCDHESCVNNGSHVVPIFRVILSDYVPACPLGQFMAVLSGYVVGTFARVQEWFDHMEDPEVVAMAYLAREFPVDFPHLVARA